MRKILSSIGFIAALLIISFNLHARDTIDPVPPDSSRRPDLLFIDSMKVFGPLKRRPVPFLHDTHVKAVTARGQDCSVCHEKKPESTRGEIVYLFNRLENRDADTVREVYHGRCIDCHEQTLARGETAGPVSCNACHAKRPKFTAGQAPMGFDHSLHARHGKARENKCDQCHHEYDKKAEKLIYIKGREGTCRYCHGSVQAENRIPMRAAAHQSCIACHQSVKAAGKSGGPIDCGGCHDPEQQAQIARAKEIPRYDRGQPDAALIMAVPPGGPADAGTLMPAVAFNHRAHESANDTCRVCHHAEMTACVQCHTLAGAPDKGGEINLMLSMHKEDSRQSCVGCHRNRTEATACVGCHSAIPRMARKDETGCSACHAAIPDAGVKPAAMSREDRNARAAAMLKSRPVPKAPPALDDIPETVVIDTMPDTPGAAGPDSTDQYKEVRLPHRKMYMALKKGIADDNLAGFFHNGEATLCRGCHHNSPAGVRPPRCGSCHRQPDIAASPLMSELRGAYHQQCLGCHQVMGVEKTGCTDCHEKK